MKKAEKWFLVIMLWVGLLGRCVKEFVAEAAVVMVLWGGPLFRSGKYCVVEEAVVMVVLWGGYLFRSGKYCTVEEAVVISPY